VLGIGEDVALREGICGGGVGVGVVVVVAVVPGTPGTGVGVGDRVRFKVVTVFAADAMAVDVDATVPNVSFAVAPESGNETAIAPKLPPMFCGVLDGWNNWVTVGTGCWCCCCCCCWVDCCGCCDCTTVVTVIIAAAATPPPTLEDVEGTGVNDLDVTTPFMLLMLDTGGV
jgi:hypothetical protein